MVEVSRKVLNTARVRRLDDTRRHRVSQGDGHSLSNDGAAAASWRAGGGPR